LGLADSAEEEEFDPNELKLLPVLATDRHQRIAKENELRELRNQQKKLMKSSKRVNDPSFGRKRNSKLNSSFYKNRGEAMQLD